MQNKKFTRPAITAILAGTMLFQNSMAVMATTPELNNVSSEVAKDIKSSTPTKNQISKFEIKKDTKKLFDFESYKNIGIVVDVEEYINIYESESTDSNILGRLPLNGGCTIISKGEEWSEIQSGSVKGYALSKYLASDKDALLKALEITYELADVTEDTKVYAAKSETSDVLQDVTAGTRFVIEEKTLDWVKIKLEDDKTGYIKSEVSNIIPELVSAEEIEQEETRVIVSEGSVSSNYEYGGNGNISGTVAGAEAGSLRAEIVNYALSFVGNPYVWGGTNPYTGADCSGFVQYVYAHFGYSIPRTTYAQWSWAVNNGKVIDPSEAQAGDLVLYDGHVAMLTGNGAEIVHASNSAPYPQGGIKITGNYAYRSILGIVRIVN